MTKRFDTLINVYDHILPTWSKWDLLAVAPSEQCQALNIESASRYRLSDGSKVMEVWVTLDFEGIYRKAPVELETEFNNFSLNHPKGKQYPLVAAPPRIDKRSIFARPMSLHAPQLIRTQSGKPQRHQSLVDTRIQNVAPLPQQSLSSQHC